MCRLCEIVRLTRPDSLIAGNIVTMVVSRGWRHTSLLTCSISLMISTSCSLASTGHADLIRRPEVIQSDYKQVSVGSSWHPVLNIVATCHVQMA